jgi:hypothetical protein
MFFWQKIFFFRSSIDFLTMLISASEKKKLLYPTGYETSTSHHKQLLYKHARYAVHH